MKMRRIKKLTSVILALILLSSCAPSAVDSVSSAMAKGEGQNQSSLISSAASVETNSEIIPSSPKNEDEDSKEEQNTSKQPSSDKETVSSDNKRPIITSRPSIKKDDEEDVSSNISTSSETEEEMLLEDLLKLEPNKRKCVMPPDNPPPVTVHREDAHIAVPISFTHILQDGEAIEFQAHEMEGTSTDLDRYISIVDSCDKFAYPFKRAAKEYDEAFFEDKALIAIVVVEPLYKAEHEIKSITHKDGQMCINLKRVKKGEGYTISLGNMFIEISKQDLKDIENIVVYEEKSSYVENGELMYEVKNLHREPIVKV